MWRLTAPSNTVLIEGQSVLSVICQPGLRDTHTYRSIGTTNGGHTYSRNSNGIPPGSTLYRNADLSFCILAGEFERKTYG